MKSHPVSKTPQPRKAAKVVSLPPIVARRKSSVVPPRVIDVDPTDDLAVALSPLRMRLAVTQAPTLVSLESARSTFATQPFVSLGRPSSRAAGAVTVAARAITRHRTGVSTFTDEENIRITELLGLNKPHPPRVDPEGVGMSSRRDKDGELTFLTTSILGLRVQPEEENPFEIKAKAPRAKLRGPPRCASMSTASSRQGGSPLRKQSNSPGGSGKNMLTFDVPASFDEGAAGALSAYLGKPLDRTVHGGYIGDRIEKLRTNEAMLESFAVFVDSALEQKRAVLRQQHLDGKTVDFVTKNAKQDLKDLSKESVSRKRHDDLERHDERVQKALATHADLLGAFIAKAETDAEERRAARRERYQALWLPIAAFAARSHCLAASLENEHGRIRINHWTAAALKIQRRYRLYLLGRPPVTFARGFVVRARFLRKVLNTRVRPRLRHRYVDRLVATLKTVHRDYKTLSIFMAMKHFARKVLLSQRQWRRRACRRAAGRHMRRLQWEAACAERITDLTLSMKRGRLVGAAPIDIADGDKAAKQLKVLKELTTAARDAILDDAFSAIRHQYEKDLAEYLRVATAPRHRLAPPLAALPPKFTQLLPHMDMPMLVNQAFREAQA